MRSAECQVNNPWVKPREWWERDLAAVHYSPVLRFFARVIDAALIDCHCVLAVAQVSHGVLIASTLPGAKPDVAPGDAALLARDWVACSEESDDRSARRYLSFPECCRQLGADVEKSRVSLLATIDSAGDYDNDECWQRLEELTQSEPNDDQEPLFDAFRCVPARDQLSLF